MATSIQATALEFNAIKNNLKSFFASQEEFADYNFEASGLSNLLDVLAYNTHYNGLIANFALNESFLNTAQLRSSVISIAEAMGYIPGSMSSAIAVVNISVDLSNATGRNSSYTLPAGIILYSELDGIVYTFRTREALIAYDDGNGLYEFTNLSGSKNINVYEGTLKQKNFTVAPYADNTSYIIPDTTIDTSTVEMKIYASSTSSSYLTFTDVTDTIEITSDSQVYFIKEAPNGYYEINFGDGSTLGRIPSAGNVINVSYLSSSGTDANTCSLFTTNQSVTVGTSSYTLDIDTVQIAAGGSDKESIESIRKNTPYQFAAQNRMVTTSDYASLILRSFPTLISDIRAYGGEEAPEPQFGTVMLSVLFADGLDDSTIESTKNEILSLVKKLAIASFTIKFVEPVKTYLEVETYFQYNPSNTSLTRSRLEGLVNESITNYFSTYTGLFEQSFRRSNMLSAVDDTLPEILSSRANVKMQQRIYPTLTVASEYVLNFPQEIDAYDDVDVKITSSYFKVGSYVCRIVNKLNSTKLQVINSSDNSVVVDNVGYYTPSTGSVNISGLTVDSIIGGLNYIKIQVVPANQSAITPTLNNVLEYDSTASFSTGVITTASN